MASVPPIQTGQVQTNPPQGTPQNPTLQQRAQDRLRERIQQLQAIPNRSQSQQAQLNILQRRLNPGARPTVSNPVGFGPGFTITVPGNPHFGIGGQLPGLHQLLPGLFPGQVALIPSQYAGTEASNPIFNLVGPEGVQVKA